MESPAINLQDKIQKLIDQYTTAKQKLETLEGQIVQLTEENSQLISQIEASGNNSLEQDAKLKALQADYANLEAKYKELQDMFAGFEIIAEDAIKKIDDIFPLLNSEE
ncbi:MAG: hypothetical protein PHO32_08885 [Candidatus Cloacimonetes bacterium]|nr:hypothetical protein [Candidatus Cloacimonadota bacterium]